MNNITAKSLLIELQCTNKDITEAQNDALSYVISFLDEIVKEVDRGNYGIEKKMIKKVHLEYSDKEVEAYIKGYEEKELEIRDKANEDKAKETGLKLVSQPCTLCGNNCQVSPSEQFKVRNGLCKELEQNIIPTEVDGLYLNIPENVEQENEECYDLLKKCKYKFEYLLQTEIENTIERDVVKKLIDKIQSVLQKEE